MRAREKKAAKKGRGRLSPVPGFESRRERLSRFFDGPELCGQHGVLEDRTRAHDEAAVTQHDPEVAIVLRVQL